MSITFELIDILIFIGICQGVFLALTMQRIVNTNKKANSILTILIALSTFMLVGRFLMIRYFSAWVLYLGLLFDIVIFLFPPLFYWYTKTFLYSEEKRKRLSVVHFIPAALFAVFVLVCFITYTPASYLEAYQEGALNLAFNSILGLAILVNGYYLYRSFRVVRDFKKVYKRSLSFEQNPIQYITFFLYAITTIIVFWAASFVNGFFDNDLLSFVSYDLVWATIPVFIYIVGYFSLKQPELFRIPFKVKTTHAKERLSAGDRELLQQKLNSLMGNDKIFLQSHLTLSEVANLLQTSSNNVSWLLNKVYETTFYDFVNKYRVEEFVRKVENNEHLRHTILALSLDVGFNSKSTFNKAFKLYKHDTPSNFIKKHQAA